jgi:hypothetical protein
MTDLPTHTRSGLKQHDLPLSFLVLLVVPSVGMWHNLDWNKMFFGRRSVEHATAHLTGLTPTLHGSRQPNFSRLPFERIAPRCHKHPNTFVFVIFRPSKPGVNLGVQVLAIVL